MPVVNQLPGLSAPYVKINYIQGQGNQYIDTLIVPNGSMEFEIKWNNMRTTASGITDMSMFGCRTDYNNNQFQLTDYVWNSGSLQTTGYFGNSTNSLHVFDLHYAGNATIITTLHGGTLSTGTGYTYNVGTDAWNRAYNLILFGSNNNGTIQELASFRLFYFRLWYNGELIRDYIPVRKLSDNSACLYDKVTEMFYTNQGSGSFIGG